MSITNEDLEKQISTLAQYTQAVNQLIIDNVTEITSQLKNIQGDIAILNAKVDKIDGNTTKNFKSVDGKLDDMQSELKKIGSVTGYDEMVSNLKIVNKQ
jgi:hypothetical protein